MVYQDKIKRGEKFNFPAVFTVLSTFHVTISKNMEKIDEAKCQLKIEYGYVPKRAEFSARFVYQNFQR